jgi:hypothetical protein
MEGGGIYGQFNLEGLDQEEIAQTSDSICLTCFCSYIFFYMLPVLWFYEL